MKDPDPARLKSAAVQLAAGSRQIVDTLDREAIYLGKQAARQATSHEATDAGDRYLHPQAVLRGWGIERLRITDKKSRQPDD